MALLFWDSFDHYATGDITEKHIAHDGEAGSSRAIGAYGRFSTNGLRICAFSTGYSWVRGPIVGYPTILTVGFAIYLEAAVGTGVRAILSLYDGGTCQITLSVTDTGALRVNNGSFGGALIGTSDAGVIAAARWYYVELQTTIDGAAGTVEVHVTDDAHTETTVIDLAGVDTQNSANAQVSMFELGGDGDNNGYFYLRYDDLYVLDSIGSTCNDFLQDTRICCLSTEGPGAYADWTPFVGPANWQDVNEIPPDDDTTYNYTLTPTDRDSFEMADLPVDATGPVLAVCAVINGRKDDAGTRVVMPGVRTVGADFDGSSKHFPNDYEFRTMYPWEVNPSTGVAWTRAQVNDVEAAYELVV